MTLTNSVLSTEYSPAFEFLSKFMDKLNATSEPVIFGSYYRKADAFASAYPDLLAWRDRFRTLFAETKKNLIID